MCSKSAGWQDDPDGPPRGLSIGVPPGRSTAGRSRPFLAALSLLFLLPIRAQAQDVSRQLEQNRQRIEEIRQERARLQREQQRLQGQAHTLDQELANIENQKETTRRIVNELERQIGTLNGEVDSVSSSLVLAQDNLADKRAVLSRRLVDIYKRGPLYAFQVLLTAESFGDLLSRYKYLYLTSRQDRALLSEVEELRNRVLRQREDLLAIRSAFSHRRSEREDELQHYSTLADERSQRLRQVRRSARSTEARLTALERDEQRLNDVVAALERARRNAAGGAAGGAGSLTTSDIGRLDWPVEGRIVFNYGRQTLPSGGVIRRNGIGIAAPVGTPVHAVESGKVVWATRLGTYGLAVLLQHGNGYYSFYGQLESASVAQGQEVQKGQTIGTVGGENSDEGPHLYFEIRGTRGDASIALDPTDWLRKRR